MRNEWFDRGWDDGLVGKWRPSPDSKEKLAYREGWCLARDELLLRSHQ
jgi:hypothetical protein